MRLISVASMLALIVQITPVVSQEATPSTTQPSSESSAGGLPESMRIQQSVTQQNARDPAMRPRGTATSTEAPGSSGAPLETNRIDPAAPSRQRLQIDDGASAAVRQNPDADTLHPGSAGTSYNTILRGTPSSTGAGMGTSGPGTSGSSRMGSSGSHSSSSGGGR
jgi:hypothetical protein